MNLLPGGLPPTVQHMLLDFGSAVAAGAALAVASYLTTGEFSWGELGASAIVGATLAARKWLQTESLAPAVPAKEPATVILVPPKA